MPLGIRQNKKAEKGKQEQVKEATRDWTERKKKEKGKPEQVKEATRDWTMGEELIWVTAEGHWAKKIDQLKSMAFPQNTRQPPSPLSQLPP